MENDSPLLPVKNKHSLLSYYLGFSAILPLAGLATSVLAIVFGVKALQYNNHTKVPGARVHAVVGIVLGSFFGFFHYAYLIVLVVALLSNLD